jgi:hypothetical protein
MAILKKLLSDSLYLFKFIGAVLAFVFVCASLFILLQKKRVEDPFIAQIQSVLKLLKKEGYSRTQGETMSEFLKSIEKKEKRFEKLDEINTLYHEGRYAKDKGHILDQLKAKILTFTKELKT